MFQCIQRWVSPLTSRQLLSFKQHYGLLFLQPHELLQALLFYGVVDYFITQGALWVKLCCTEEQDQCSIICSLQSGQFVLELKTLPPRTLSTFTELFQSQSVLTISSVRGVRTLCRSLSFVPWEIASLVKLLLSISKVPSKRWTQTQCYKEGLHFTCLTLIQTSGT